MDCVIAIFAAFGFVRFVVVAWEMLLGDETDPDLQPRVRRVGAPPRAPEKEGR